MKFYMYTQHLQLLTDPAHCVTLGHFSGVRELQARLIKANRWSKSRDAVKLVDGIMLINHHLWHWYGKSVRSRVIESFAYIIPGGPEQVPDPHHFINHLAEGIDALPEVMRKVSLFSATNRMLNGDYCEDYRPAITHYRACPYCSAQFLHDVQNKSDLKIIETKAKSREFMRRFREARRKSLAKARTHQKGKENYVQKAKSKYAFALPPEQV
jgi:hypothetical protein